MIYTMLTFLKNQISKSYNNFTSMKSKHVHTFKVVEIEKKELKEKYYK